MLYEIEFNHCRFAIIGVISASNISQAFAADIADPAGCTVMGLVEGAGFITGKTQT